MANVEPHFGVDPAFRGASYAERYQVLCERLVLERKYSAACLVLATNEHPTRVTFPTDGLAFRRLAAAAEGHVRAFLAAG